MNRKNIEKIAELKQVFNSFGVSTDKDMYIELGITKDDDKRMIQAWVNYQSAFEYRDGYVQGQNDLNAKLIKIKNKLKKLIKLSNGR